MTLVPCAYIHVASEKRKRFGAYSSTNNSYLSGVEELNNLESKKTQQNHSPFFGRDVMSYSLIDDISAGLTPLWCEGFVRVRPRLASLPYFE
jgi:hypothetical protein